MYDNPNNRKCQIESVVFILKLDTSISTSTKYVSLLLPVLYFFLASQANFLVTFVTATKSGATIKIVVNFRW